MNIYERFNKSSNPSPREFILRYYQVIPKYYLLSRDQRKLILSYSMGSGKTAAAIFIASYYYNNIKKMKFLNKFSLTNLDIKNTKILVIGSWATENAFIKDLMQPIFGYVSNSVMKDVNYKLKSTFKDLRKEGEEDYVKIINTIRKSFIFNNFQAVFNKTFPNYQFTQDVDSLMELYQNGQLTAYSGFLESLRDSVVVVDEFQHMYSNGGMNTYGFVIGTLVKKCVEYNIHFVFMSGTMINNSLYEVPFLMSILNEKEFINPESYLVEKEIINHIMIKTLREDKLNEVYDFFSPMFLYYDQRSENGLDKEKITIQTCDNNVNLNKSEKLRKGKPNEIKMLVIESNDKDLPVVRHIGNTLIEYDGKILMNLFELPLSGFQNDQYENYVKSKSNIESYSNECEDQENDKDKYDRYKYEIDRDRITIPVPQDDSESNDEIESSLESNDENNSTEQTEQTESMSGGIDFDLPLESSKKSKHKDESNIQVHDGIFDKKSLELRTERGSYVGDGLLYDRLINYSAIGCKIIELAINNTLHRQKTVFYHERLINFGLKQYSNILNYNGFIKYGTNPRNNTLCSRCGKKLMEHTKIRDHKFNPMTYCCLFGEISTKERNELIQVYNSENNLYGELISVIFISRVAAAGLNILHTNNLVILQRIPGISLWKQICGRVIRTKSHSLLPSDKRFVNVYTLIVSSSYEREKLEMSYDRQYYTIRSIQHQEISKFMNEVYHHSITDKLFKNPEEFGESNVTEITLFNNDVRNEINFAFKSIRISITLPWNMNRLIQCLRNEDYPLSYINFNTITDKELISELVNEHLIRLQKYRDFDEPICIPYSGGIKKKMSKYVTTFSFNQLSSISVSSRYLIKLVSSLSKYISGRYTPDEIPYDVKIQTTLNQIMKVANYNYDETMDKDIFWRAIYAVHDEYYPDDSTNFIKNHSTEGRNFNRLAGFYCNNQVLLKDGGIIKIHKPDFNNRLLKNNTQAFTITSYGNQKNNSWLLKIVITEPNDSIDKRAMNRGVICTTYPISRLSSDFESVKSKIADGISRQEICREFISELCDYVLSTRQSNKILTPFN